MGIDPLLNIFWILWSFNIIEKQLKSVQKNNAYKLVIPSQQIYTKNNKIETTTNTPIKITIAKG